MILALLLALALDGTARCDAARREAIRLASEAWLPAEPTPKSWTGLAFYNTSMCECGDCTSLAIVGSQPSPGSAYYECKAAAAREREAARDAAQKRAAEQDAREDAAREALYRVRDACGEGPVRPGRTR